MNIDFDDCVYLDFEFNNTSEETLNLVSCVVEHQQTRLVYWLHKDPEAWENLREELYDLKDKIFVAFQAVAEARSMLDLGLPVEEFKWIDLALEYRQLSNHNHRIQYGEHYSEGKVKKTYPPKPKWERIEGESANSFKQKFSLAEAIYKFLRKKIDTKRKDEIRDLIISCPEKFHKDEKKEILAYNLDDVVLLPKLFKAICRTYLETLPEPFTENLLSEMALRGNFAARTAKMEKLGYPVNVPAMKNITDAIPTILRNIQKDINDLFPNIMPFKFNKDGTYSWRQKETREWLEENLSDVEKKGWILTPNKSLSLSLEAFQRFYNYRHDFPTDSFPAQIVRYLLTKQNFNGFIKSKTGKNKKTIWDSLGSDNRVRPYFNIYGSSTSRSQPSSISFLFLKSAWMRFLCQPRPGRAIVDIDYGSEEALIAALLSEDYNMIESYASGDVYLAYAKLAGAVPKDGTKKDYAEERNLFKSSYLGISYQMSKYGLSDKLTKDMGKDIDEDEAQELIDLFYESYPDLKEWQENTLDYYEDVGVLQAPCGWMLLGDSDNFRSVNNFLVQATGASLMRKAVQLAQDAGLEVVFTLHDALYIECDSDKALEAHDILAKVMREAFVFYFKDSLKEKASMIRLDGHTWSLDFPEEDEYVETPAGYTIKKSKIYIDERARDQYNKYAKYAHEEKISL